MAEQHRAILHNGIRQVAEPTQPEWAEYERDGTARAQCSCGLDTGWVPSANAASYTQ
ncbi:hypothetical protein ACFXGT_28440 [Streptomyces sp. NPDC059352]|uniref:hypothetical protein n=1 Tax=Streptomyces sp. NPDC059352 TaxID=3346810 RepID=UPI003689DD84